MSRNLKCLGLMLLLMPVACAAPPAPPPRPVRTPPPPPLPTPTPDPVTPGVASVMGQTAARLQALFGRPSLDIQEGYARKLQFANASCVLDAYLYPPAAGREAVVTHVDARLPDGRDYNAASCIAALTRPGQAP